MTEQPITLLAVGDIMLGDSPYCFGHGVASMIERHGPLFPFTHVRDTLRQGDITIGNLEIVISRHDRASDPFTALEYRAQPEAVKGIADCEFDLLSAASNHTMEHGRSALEETLTLLDKHKIKYIGVDIPEKEVQRHCFLECKGRVFCFLGYNFRPQQYFLDPPLWPAPDLELIKEDIDSVKDRADIIVIAVHWGDEFITYPSPAQVELGHALIDHGAHIILGHHPHILQGVEKYHRGLIAYSLGNFVFDMWQKRLRRTMILKVIINPDNSVIYEIIPVLINRRHQPEILSGEQGNTVRAEIEELSARIGTTDRETYEKELQHNFGQFRKDVYKYYLANLLKYNPKFLLANFLGAMKKRL